MTLAEVGRQFGVTAETVRQELLRAGVRFRCRGWSSEEVERLREMYSSRESVAEMARQLGRPYYGVALKASRLGLTVERGRQAQRAEKSPAQARITVTNENRWRVYQHPRGMAGKKHTPETLARNAALSHEMWERDKANGTGLMAPEQRQRRSDRAVAMNAGRTASENYSRAKRGRRPDLPDIFFRSRWEANYARYLQWLIARGEIDRWEYEPDTFWFEAIRRGVRSYTPDFKVFEGAKTFYVEVKGWMDPKSETKLRRMSKYHPGVRVDLVDQRVYREIERRLGRLIPCWEFER